MTGNLQFSQISPEKIARQVHVLPDGAVSSRLHIPPFMQGFGLHGVIAAGVQRVKTSHQNDKTSNHE